MTDRPESHVQIVAATAPSIALAEALARALAGGDPVIVAAAPAGAGSFVAALVAALDAPAAATSSPVPVAGVHDPAGYPAHPAAPSPASLPLACPALCAINPEAAASVGWEPHAASSAGDAVRALSETLHHHGWRHVTAPGVALAWEPGDAAGITATAGWTERSVAALAGPANTALEAQVSWATSQLGGTRVVVDGACMTALPYTGTQHVVLEVSRWLARTRPDATVLLAAPEATHADLRAALSGEAVQVVARRPGLDADVVYRPYQMLYAAELPFVVGTGRRGLVGQLDMIGFSNPAYHPSDNLLFFARNLQRHLMRVLDGVTFISEFGRETAFAECPDLDVHRLHVVSCGADPAPLDGELGDGRGLGDTTPFVTCLSSTFWHKNRVHAIRTFAALAEHHGYPGHLVIAGPEPYFGRSLAAEDAVLAALPAEVAARVHRWGQVGEDEKWWLLRHADLALYPSVIEGFGLVPFEAATVATPCLVPAQTATAELLGDTAAAVRSWDPRAWAAHAAALIADPQAAAELVAATSAVATAHTWERCAEATWQAIDHALASPRRALHADDGGALVRVADTAAAPAARARFDIVRGVPAVRRRLSRLVSGRRSHGDS